MISGKVIKNVFHCCFATLKYTIASNNKAVKVWDMRKKKVMKEYKL